MYKTSFDTGDIDEVILANESGLPDAEVIEAIKAQVPEFARIGKWVDSWSGKTRSGGIANQDVYVGSDAIFDQFRTASFAAKNDDIVSNALEVTEQLAFKTVTMECGNDDETNIANQMIDNIDLEKRMREIWRELFTVSQCYISVLWERKDFKVKGNSKGGTKRKKVFKNLLVPKGLTVLDPCRIIPVGNFMFGQERLAYIADVGEAKSIRETLADANSSDLIVKSLFDQEYKPSLSESMELSELTGQSNLLNRLFLLNEKNVWRITHTRPAYQRFADVRMVSVFEILDQKHQLRASDRSDLLGNLNCIVLVKKGSDKYPAKGNELAGAAAQMQQSAKVPLIVSDHRLEIEIITKKTDNVLRPERYNTLNSSITSRLFQILNTGNYSSGSALDDSSKLFKVIASTMEARRDEIRDSIMDKVIERIWEENDSLDGEPNMIFNPRRIALEFNPQFTEMIFQLFVRGDVSRDTMLAELDISQEQEAAKREREDAEFGHIFIQKLLPGQAASPDSLSTGSPAVDGKTLGGNNNGGGTNGKSFQASPKNEPKTAKPAKPAK